ncbi:unnamed protein product [Auanema sp. JU1783]|nr:unnamed protein product [Auanema sp. JU1783]
MTTECSLQSDALNDNAVSKPADTTKVSDMSSALIKEAQDLLDAKPSTRPTISTADCDILENTLGRTIAPRHFTSSSSTLLPRQFSSHQLKTESDIEEKIYNRKAPAKALQESINDSYHKVKRTIETQINDAEDPYRSSRHLRSPTKPFRHLDGAYDRYSGNMSSSNLSSLRRSASASYNSPRSTAGYSSPYAAPAVSLSQGIESRYDYMARDIEDRLLRTCPLPKEMKNPRTYVRPSPVVDNDDDDDDDYSVYAPRTYYSRPNRDDPDYFDYDLQHSVDLFKRPEGRYTPRGPQNWETKLLNENTNGSAPLSGYMFTKGDTDWRSNGSSYLSAALRTPKFWEQRFDKLGKEIRDSNPLSLESVNRNRPIASRFTEYRDPDLDYESD